MTEVPVRPARLWLVLVSRTLLFAAVQALIALGFWLADVPGHWSESSRWWLFSAVITNLASIAVLTALLRREGKGYRDALAELPTYFGYLMPRLARRPGGGWLAWLSCSLVPAGQHATLPLVLNWRFALWRAGMFLPFALYIGLAVKLRPRLLPYLMAGHFLIDLGTLAVYLTL